jgi:beta-lactamase regulating signal transducer with metallopeptidase domain
MTTELNGILQALLTLSLVLSVQIVLVLTLRKPVRALLGSIACYRLWLVTLLWLPAYALGGKALQWWRDLRNAPTEGGLENFQLLLDDWVYQPLDQLGNATGRTGATLELWEIAALLWLAGACVIFAWQLRKYRRFSQHVQQHARSLAQGDALTFEVSAVFGTVQPAIVLAGMNSAALFGIHKPVLLLSACLAEHYDADQRHIILAHEAVHLRRRDNAWNLAAGLLVILNWPNPLFWLAWRRFRFDQELSCDALALTSCTPNQQKRYARTLLDAASAAAGFGPQPALSAWDNFNDLKGRTLMITQHLKNKVSPVVVQGCLSVIAVGGAVVMALLAGSFSPMTVAAEPEQSENRIDPGTGLVLRTAMELLNEKNYAEARAKLSVLNPRSLSPYELSRLEQMYFNLDINAQDYAGARRHMEAALVSGGMNAEEVSTGRYQLAQLWLQEEKWIEAAAALKEWLGNATDPKGGAYYLLAVAYYNLERFDEALPHAQQAVALGGEKAQEGWLQMLSALYLRAEQYENALPVVRELVRRFPDKEVYQTQLNSIEKTIQQTQLL